MHRFLLFWIFLLCVLNTYAQLGGNSTYEFLRLPNSARVTALGGNLITVQDEDLTLVSHNPALLNPRMHQQIAFSQSIHPAGITHGYLGYGHQIKPISLMVHGGIQYIDYGKFNGYDQQGYSTGDFRAREFAIALGTAYKTGDYLTFGTNIKTVLSYLGGFNSVGLAMDFGATFQDTAKNISMSLVLQNVGSQFSTYGRDKEFEYLPFDFQFGFTHKLKYLPLRFTMVAHHLHRWDISYNDPDLVVSTSLTDTTTTNGNNFGKGVDNFFRHLIFNLELLLGKREIVRLRFGYNHLRRRELNISGFNTFAGFSLGVGIKVSKFRIDYGFGSYHTAGTAHHFTLSTNIHEFKKG